ncbi:MAG TPA: hypothetical protein VFL57_12625 [Bryobacteraceae bacterium]|nr:hypothetical protein [Bryobacteraceae bacterium]
MGIRYNRVLLGGLLAGVVINVFEFVLNAIILRDAWADTMRRLNLPGEMTTNQIVLFNVWGFVMGILAVWTYAAIRSRFGPGPKTAGIAALVMWLAGYALSIAPPVIMHMFPRRLAAVALAVGLVEIIAATIAGASLYKEDDTTRATTRAARA